MLTGVQIRMARNALRWSVRELADNSDVSTSTITRAETGDGVPTTTRANLIALKSALEAAGIEFIGTPDDGPGIRMRLPANR
ncbi:helix-turn-helix domain-containing protein [Sphingorhabdus sp.]|uniref:helix-turn-helix domain-containing protein n=1 Tax=Sphingorhabdus sp. TaxID=1902408 RepID=UPI003FA7B64D